MAGFSDSEVEGAVSKFVRSTITVERDELGPVKQDARFNEVVELISSTLIFDPNAIFYLIYLATNRLNKDVLATIELVDDLLDAITSMGHRTKEVTRTTLLGDASTALLEVDSILTSRDALSTAAFSRYVASLDSFTAVSLEPNIKKDAQIIRPPQKARPEARSLLSSISAAYTDHLQTLDQIEQMLSEFNGLNLPVIALQDSVRKARSDLADIQQVFEDVTTTRDDKIAETRDAYLRLTAGKSVLQNYTTVTDPSSPRLSSTASLLGRPVEPLGTGQLLSAEVLGARSAPWSIESGVNDELKISEDGAAETTYTITPPSFPSVQSYLGGPYDIHSSSTAQLVSTNPENYSIPSAPDNKMSVTITDPALSGPVTFTGTITSGTRTGAQVAADIGALSDGSNPLSTYLTIDYLGGVRLTHQTPGDYLIIVNENPDVPIPSPNPNTVVGFVGGVSARGEDANDLLEIDGLVPRVQLTSGAARTRAQIAADIDSWAVSNYPGEYAGLDDGTYVTIQKTKSGGQELRLTADNDTDTVRRAYAELGFFEGQEDTTEGTTAAEVATIINAVGLVDASVVRNTLEEGNNGTVVSSTVMNIPLGTLDLGDPHASRILLIRSGPNAGPHRIASFTLTSITVESDTPFNDLGGDQSWAITEELLQLSSKVSDLTSELTIGSGNANTELGFSTGTTKGTTTGFRATENGVDQDFVRADVVVCDILRLTGMGDYRITEISDSKQLEVDPPLDVDDGPAALNFQILSAAAVAYETFIADALSWENEKDTSTSPNYRVFSTSSAELDRVMNPLLTNKNPSVFQIEDATNTTRDFKSLLEDLVVVLESFFVNQVGRVDAALKMLIERGLDRAYDTLLDGKISDFFGFDKDDASRAAFMLKSMRKVVQNDLNQSKLDEDVDDITHGALVVSTDADLDFSDADQDERFEPLGEIPDVTEEDEAILRQRL